LAWRQPLFAFGVGHSLSLALFKGYLHQPYIFHLQRNSAQLVNNATQEINVLVQNGLLSGLNLLAESLVLVGILGVMLFVEPVGTLAVMFLLGAAIWIYHRQTYARILNWGSDRQSHEGFRIQSLHQGLGGVKDVKLLGREQEFVEQYAYNSVKTCRAQRFQSLIGNLPRLWLEWIAVLALAVLVISMLAQGKPATQLVPTLGLFAAAAFRLMPSMNRMIINAQSIRFALPVIHHLSAEMSLFRNSPKLAANLERLSFDREICIRDLSYAYPKAHRHALTKVGLKIPRGSSVGFVGSSGAGKSTLVDIILGLLTPVSGQVLVDGQDIQSNLRSWQNLIGYVPQNIYLTDDTLRRNVAFGLAENQIDNAAVRKAIKAAQLEDFVADLPQGLETVVGERGIRLSGGQRQRIGIARALYHDPEVLVLDEATSSLDTATEQDVMQAVRALHGEKTVLIVAHRLSTVAHCDRLYRLEQGQLVISEQPMVYA
jgi:ABC-type multidrug transport system fused ATPase/permease subunit